MMQRKMEVLFRLTENITFRWTHGHHQNTLSRYTQTYLPHFDHFTYTRSPKTLSFGTVVALNEYDSYPHNRTTQQSPSVVGFSEQSHNSCLMTEEDRGQDIETIFRIINMHSSSEPSMAPSLSNSGVVFTNTLVERVLKRVRFSNGNGFKAMEFFNWVGRQPHYSHTSEAYNQMLFIVARMRKFDTVWELLEEMHRNDPKLITHKTMQIVLARFAKVCPLRETVEAFESLEDYTGVLDVTAFNALLRALCQERNMKDVGIVYHQLKKQFNPNTQSFNILLSGWQTAERALSFYDEMLQLGQRPDIVTYNSLLHALCKDRNALYRDRGMRTVIKIMEEMKNSGCHPDLKTYTILIGGLGLIRENDQARMMLVEMRDHGCHPDAAAYNAVIRNFCMGQRVRDAYKVLDEMVNEGIDPNPKTYNSFIRYYYRSKYWEEGWDVYRRMIETRCFPCTQTCILLMRLLCRHEELKRALQLWDDMLEKGFGSYSLVLDVLIDVLCDNGKLNEAEKCFLETIEKGHKPSSFAYKRLRVLLEIAQKHESIHNLSKKMKSIDYQQ
ncbi:hypothetical protein KI387_020502 [Taxus chinensis]|uniref:Pentatricopeptide repeat-containing protein n=1 Tax=Taxus chinensis TaxID=29808 RepID=A0AA38GBG1_TAXCH|nr:hypothetical protein KI387_020502 [Taxus chinensis]